MSSLTKYLDEQQPEHNGRLFWPGHMDFPFRGPAAPLLKQNEIEEDVEVVSDFHEREFDLTIADDHEAYVNIMDRILAQWYALIFIERWRHPVTHHRMVRLEWAQQYSQLKPQAAGVQQAGSSIPKVG